MRGVELGAGRVGDWGGSRARGRGLRGGEWSWGGEGRGRS